MRNFIDIVAGRGRIDEAKRPVKVDTKTDTTSSLNFMPELERGLTTTGPKAGRDMSARADTTSIAPKRAGAKKTRAAMAGASFGDGAEEAGRHFSSLASADLGNDIIDDDEAARRAGHDADDLNTIDADVPDTTLRLGSSTPTTPENLPTIINSAVAEAGATIAPEWHMVKHLPGYMKQGIRALGRAVFGQFTDTSIEDIQVLSTLVNPEHDVRGMMSWIRKNGVRDDSAVIDFSRIMPGYSAETSLWNVQGGTFLLVKDFGGYYIYGWPGGRGVHLDAPKPQGRLR